MDRLGKGLPNLYLGTELPRFSSGSSKDRSGMNPFPSSIPLSYSPLWIPRTPSDLKTQKFRSFVILVATKMSSLFVALFAFVASTFRPRAALQAEILALRHQLVVFRRNAPRRVRLHRCVPALVGFVVPILVQLAAMSADGSARHGPPLAPPSFRLALDQEIAPSSRKARSCGEPS
jgi:hypothetical protein